MLISSNVISHENLSEDRASQSFKPWFNDYEIETKAKGWSDSDRLERLPIYVDDELRALIPLLKVDNNYEKTKQALVETLNKGEEETLYRTNMYQKLYETYKDFQEFALDKVLQMNKLDLNATKQAETLKGLLPH